MEKQQIDRWCLVSLLFFLISQNCLATSTEEKILQLTVKEGGTAVFKCTLDTKDGKYMVYWFAEKAILVSDSRFEMQQAESGEYLLTIRRVNPENAREYYCRMNDNPSSIQRFNLHVSDDRQSDCIDRDGHVVQHGDHYYPRSDPCYECTCNDGLEDICRSVLCHAPKCKNFKFSTERCCEYTCEKDDGRSGCIDRDGHVVQYGDHYFPRSDPCYECLCNQGAEDICRSVLCDAPKCKNFKLSTERCCEYTCEQEPPSIESNWHLESGGQTLKMVCFVAYGYPKPTLTWYKDEQVLPGADADVLLVDLAQEETGVFTCLAENGVGTAASQSFGKSRSVLGSLGVQQTGLTSAIAQVKLPSMFNASLHGTPIFEAHIEGAHDYTRSFKTYLTMVDLDPNMALKAQVYPMSKATKVPILTRKVEFALKPKAGTGLSLSGALGEVIQSRGGSFTTINGRRLILNLNNYYEVEISQFSGSQCPHTECGMLFFGIPGVPERDMYLIFLDERVYNKYMAGVAKQMGISVP